METKILVNLLDTHKVVLHGLRMEVSCSEEVEIINQAYSGEELLEQLAIRQPHILIMDYCLDYSNTSRGMTGFETAQIVMQRYPLIKILILTIYDEAEYILPCLEKGIHGYMLKGEKEIDICDAIHELYHKGFYFSPRVLNVMALNMDYLVKKPEVTPREVEILECLLMGDSTKEIGEKLFISNHTVESHRKNLMQKFMAKNSINLVFLALRQGYIKVEGRS